METVSEISSFFNDKGYKEYNQHYEYPVAYKTLFQKKVESEKVCDCNDKLCVNIDVYKFHDNPYSFTVSITGEQDSVWWDLQCYSLNEKEIKKKLESIEKTLIKMFNAIP